MGKSHHRFRHQFLDLGGHLINIADPVVDIVNLPGAGQFPYDCLSHHLVIVLADKSLDGDTLSRCLLQNTHVTDTHKAHVEGSGDGGCRQCQHIHILFHLLDFLLVGDPKPLLLVHNEQSQIFELHILGKHPVGADKNVHKTFFQIFQCLFLFRRSAETAE